MMLCRLGARRGRLVPPWRLTLGPLGLAALRGAAGESSFDYKLKGHRGGGLCAGASRSEESVFLLLLLLLNMFSLKHVVLKTTVPRRAMSA